MTLQTVYKCADGTDFPVTWDNPSDAEVAWRFDPEHAPLPCPDVEADLRTSARQEGLVRAGNDFGLPSLAASDRVRILHGFAYTHRPTPSPEDARATRTAFDDFTARRGGPLATWEQLLLPKIREVCGGLSEAPDTADPEEIIKEMWYGFGFAQVSYQAGLMGMLAPLRQFCAQEFEEDADTLAGGLTKGYPSATLEADQELWQLAQQVRNNASLSQALATASIDGVALQSNEEFWSSFQAFIDAHGHRAGHWQIAAPTWFEQPESALAIVGRLAASNRPSPMHMMQEAATEREALIHELESRLADDPEKLDSFRRMVAESAANEPLREGRVYWQLHCFGYAREALIRIGARLTREGRIAEPQDVMFLTPAEIKDSENQDLAGGSYQRRALWERRCHISPPVVMGNQSSLTINPESFISLPVEQAGQDGSIKGAGASPGVVTGRARLIRSPADGARLSPGDVLVCVMTAPPWTTLFGIAGAVVTETGGVLSHPAIVARESGIPCVVGARGATSRIQDGQLITVDGTKGEVRLEE